MLKEDTVNLQEVSKFNNQSKNWWCQESKDFEMLHRLNPVRLDFILGHLRGHFGDNRQLKVVDLGCGGGILCEPLARLGFDVAGIDAGENNIQIAQNHAQIQNLDIKYYHSNITEHEGLYDVLICLEVLEHVDNVEVFLSHFKRLLKPNGLLVISTINKTLKSLLLAKFMAEYVLNIVPKNTHDWNKFIDPFWLVARLDKFGFNLKDLQGLHYNPIFKSFSLNKKDLSVNYFGVFVCGG